TGARVARADAEIAGGRDAGGAAGRDALDGADRGLMNFLQRAHHQSAELDLAATLQHRLRVALEARLGQVRADGEVATLGADDDGARVRVLRELARDALDVFHHLVGDGVALFGAVDRDGGDGAVARDFDMGRHRSHQLCMVPSSRRFTGRLARAYG